MKHSYKTLLVISLTTLLLGCGRELEEGEVIGKRYEPARNFVMLIPVVTSCGKSCTNTMMIPYLVHDDEDYILTVRGTDTDGEVITESWYVDKTTYESVEEGRREVYTQVNASRDDQHERISKAES